MKKALSALSVLTLAFGLVLAGCGTGGNGNAGEASGKAETPAAAPANEQTGPLTINQSLPNKEILSKGPNGENAVSAKTLQLTPEELAKIKQGNYKAALAMHYAGNDWSTAQIKGLKETFAKMGIEVIATTDANFKSEKQVSDIETILSKKPNIIVSIPVDPVSTAAAYKKKPLLRA